MSINFSLPPIPIGSIIGGANIPVGNVSSGGGGEVSVGGGSGGGETVSSSVAEAEEDRRPPPIPVRPARPNITVLDLGITAGEALRFSQFDPTGSTVRLNDSRPPITRGGIAQGLARLIGRPTSQIEREPFFEPLVARNLELQKVREAGREVLVERDFARRVEQNRVRARLGDRFRAFLTRSAPVPSDLEEERRSQSIRRRMLR